MYWSWEGVPAIAGGAQIALATRRAPARVTHLRQGLRPLSLGYAFKRFPHRLGERQMIPMKHILIAAVAGLYVALSLANGGYSHELIAGACVGIWWVVVIAMGRASGTGSRCTMEASVCGPTTPSRRRCIRCCRSRTPRSVGPSK